jgi:ABC-type uncharacterized transport system ATPase subunit
MRLAQARHRWQFTEASLFTLYSSQPGGPVQPVISVSDLTKTYASGLQGLKKVNLQIWPGEIFALLGPNGAGKTTLIDIICGIVNPTRGVVLAGGHNVISDYKAADCGWWRGPILSFRRGR